MKSIFSKSLVIFSLIFFYQSVLSAASSAVSFKTGDGLTLKARFHSPSGKNPVVIMLHGLAATKEEFAPLEAKLIQEGWGTLAYDARGHGESSLTKDSHGVYDGYRYFGQPGPGSQWEKMIDDVGAAIRFLKKEKGLSDSTIYVCGASLGANVALNYAALTRSPRAMVLLSPGLNYAEVETAAAIREVNSLPVLIVASPHDAYAHNSSKTLKKMGKNVTLWDDVKPGHGVQMFDDQLLSRIFTWLKSHP